VDVADELVRDAEVDPTDLVVEIGAGTGRLTRPLAKAASRVIAVELDRVLVARLGAAFDGDSNVSVVAGDALTAALPIEPFRVVGNLPFGRATAILRRLLDDPSTPVRRVDVLVQYEVARKRSAVWPGSLRAMSWAPWWRFDLVRRVPAGCFEPAPSVDAGMLAIIRRRAPLLDSSRRPEFLALLERAYRRGGVPVRRSLAVPPRTWKRFARARGISVNALPSTLDVRDWLRLFESMRA
jgi:23S rRNA (adenine-N6)-dimethyltransferase